MTDDPISAEWLRDHGAGQALMLSGGDGRCLYFEDKRDGEWRVLSCFMDGSPQLICTLRTRGDVTRLLAALKFPQP